MNSPPLLTDRKELLLRMYDQLFNDINRHILVVWQSVGVVVGAFALLSLTEKQVITLDLATAVFIVLVAWLIAHLYDASFWYNRNLVMIANIERQFLSKDDLRLVHYYFGKHRPKNRMISHLRVQYALAIGLGALVLRYHFITRVIPGFGLPLGDFDLQRAMPYLFVVGAAWYLSRLNETNDAAYAEFLTNSPGLDVDTTGIVFGVGHGFRGKAGTEGAPAKSPPGH